MSLDSAIRNIAQRVTRATGMEATIQRVTVGTYSTATRTVTNTTEEQTVTGRLDEYMAREVGGTIEANDRKLIIAALDLDWTPIPHDQVVIGDLTYDIVSVKQDTAAQEAAFYTLQLRV